MKFCWKFICGNANLNDWGGHMHKFATNDDNSC